MRTEKRSVLFWSGMVATSVVAALVSTGCSEESEDPGGLLGGGNKPGSGIGGAQSSGGAGAGLSPGVAGNFSLAGTPNIIIGTSGTGGSGGNEESCAGKVSKATQTPVNMFIQFDRSFSMTMNNKWTQAAKALNAFFQDPESDGLKVALRFFPDDNPVPGCQGGDIGTCDPVSCSQPLVPLGALLAEPGDTQEQLLVQAVAAANPGTAMFPGGGKGGGFTNGGTPIFPALEGALTWAKANQMATPNERTVVVLVTDGEPTGCDEDIDHIAALASEALASAMVQTYAIGIQGANAQQMHAIARAGGTERAYFAGNAATAQQDLLDALNSIRGSVLACQFEVPESDTGVVDPNKVNIQFTDGAGVVTPLLKAADATACGAEDGWYYDNPTSPTSISLCASTCAKVQAQGSAQLDVQVGCETKVR